MPSKQLIAYAAPGGAPASASGCCAGARQNAAFGMENVDTVFIFFFNQLSSRRWWGQAGARLFAVVSGLLFTLCGKQILLAKNQRVAIEELLAEIFGLLFLV